MNISDTSAEAKKVICELYRRMSPARKIELIFDAYRTGWILSMGA